MYSFIPPLVILAPRFKCGCLRASLLTVLRVVYAIVQLSSGKIPGKDHGFRNQRRFDLLCGSHQLPEFLKYSVRLMLLAQLVHL